MGNQPTRARDARTHTGFIKETRAVRICVHTDLTWIKACCCFNIIDSKSVFKIPPQFTFTLHLYLEETFTSYIGRTILFTVV